MSSPSSETEKQNLTEAAVPETLEPTRPTVARFSRNLFTALGCVLIILLLKLGLTAGRLVWTSSDNYLPSFPEEVLAEEHKAKTTGQDPASQKKAAAPSPANQTTSLASATPSVADMVSQLEQREAALKKKEETLRQKEEYLTKMEQDVEKKQKELMAIQKEIQAYRTEKEEASSAKIRSLAKIYGTMKPKEAAKLLENLEDHLVVSVISTMTADEAGNILSNMDVKKAAKISESLSHK